MSLHSACHSTRLALSGRAFLKASREVMRSRRHMSDAESTTAVVANAAAAVVKDDSWQGVAKDMVRNGGGAFFMTASLLVGFNSYLERTITSETNSSIGKTNQSIERLSSETKASIAETNMNIERLSSDTKVRMGDLRDGIREEIRVLDKNIERLSTNTLLGAIIVTAMIGVVSMFKK